jgi:multidrug resistance protein
VARLLILFITAFVDMVGLAMILPLLPYYATRFGANATLVGVLISAYSVAQLAVAPAWGRYSDRVGRRPAIVTGLVVTAAAYALFAVADTVVLLLVSRVVQGVGAGTIGVVQAYVADASRPEDRTRALGWLSAVTSLGAVVGPAIGSVLVALGGQRFPGFAAIFSALVAVFAWRFLAEPRMEFTTTDPTAPFRKEPIGGRDAVFRVITHWRETAPRLVWIYAIGIGAFYGTIPIVPLLLEDRLGVTERTIGFFVMYLGGMGVLVRAFLLGPAVDRLGEPRLARVGIWLLGAGLLVTAFARTLPGILAGFTLMPLGTASLFPCVTGLLSSAVHKRERGVYLGVQQTFGGVSRVAFPVAAGLAMDRAGMGTPFAVAAALLVLTLPLTRGLRSQRAQAAAKA